MAGWQIAMIWAGVGFVLMLPFLIRWWSRPVCPKCYYPKHRCECGCKHDLTTKPRWSQDGWVAKCLLCTEIVYLGDDFDGGPNARGDVAS